MCRAVQCNARGANGLCRAVQCNARRGRSCLEGSVEDRGVEVGGHEAGADALDLVGARGAAADHRRLCRLDGKHLRVRGEEGEAVDKEGRLGTLRFGPREPPAG